MSLEVSSLRARAHPIRLRMLSLLTRAPRNAAELARELDLTHANASYHLRVLVGSGLVSLAGEEKVRGGTAKRYRYNLDAPAPRGVNRGAEASYADALGQS
jgi:DNA-binding transcriptional ArsR family regulator